MKHSLDIIPQDYFEYKIGEEQPRRKQSLWVIFIISLAFIAIAPTNFMSGEVPEYLNIIKYVFLGLCAILFIFCISYNTKNGSAVLFHFLSMYSSWIFVLSLWIFISQFSIIVCCSGGGNSLDPKKTTLVSIISLFVLLIGVLIYLYFYFRLRKRIMQGHYRKGGKGFWDNHERKKTLLRVLAVAAPVSMSFSTASIFLGRFWGITLNEAHVPIVAIITPLLMVMIFLPFAYLNAVEMLRIYYIKRFGQTSPNKVIKDDK